MQKRTTLACWTIRRMQFGVRYGISTTIPDTSKASTNNKAKCS